MNNFTKLWYNRNIDIRRTHLTSTWARYYPLSDCNKVSHIELDGVVISLSQCHREANKQLPFPSDDCREFYYAMFIRLFTEKHHNNAIQSVSQSATAIQPVCFKPMVLFSSQALSKLQFHSLTFLMPSAVFLLVYSRVYVCVSVCVCICVCVWVSSGCFVFMFAMLVDEWMRTEFMNDEPTLI